MQPRLEPDSVRDDHVGVTEGQQVGGGRLESVGLDPGSNEHVDLDAIAADALGEEAQWIDRGDYLEAVGGAFPLTAGSCKD